MPHLVPKSNRLLATLIRESSRSHRLHASTKQIRISPHHTTQIYRVLQSFLAFIHRPFCKQSVCMEQSSEGRRPQPKEKHYPNSSFLQRCHPVQLFPSCSPEGRHKISLIPQTILSNSALGSPPRLLELLMSTPPLQIILLCLIIINLLSRSTSFLTNTYHILLNVFFFLFSFSVCSRKYITI